MTGEKLPEYTPRHAHREGSDRWRIRLAISKTYIHTPTPGYAPRHGR